MMKALLAEAKSRHCQYIICKIAKSPFFNKASYCFHQKMGFKSIGIVRDKENSNGIYELFYLDCNYSPHVEVPKART